MRHFIVLLFCFLQFTAIVDAQERVIDAKDKSPVAAASIFNAAGNMIGVTLNDGVIEGVPPSAYPITIRSIGYEQLVIEQPGNKAWGMTPKAYELEELVVVPVERNILKQTFYAREHFSMTCGNDTVTLFLEHMAHRFLPASEEAKFSGSSSLRILCSRSYAHYRTASKDSVATDGEALFPSLLSIFDLNEEPITAPASFNKPGEEAKLYEKPGKSGMSLVLKQNAHTFISTEDMLADSKKHSLSVWPLKLVGITFNMKQFYSTHTYGVNDNGIYTPKDLIEAGFAMEADGGGKTMRKIFEEKEGAVVIRSMIELYVVGRDYLSKEEAKKEYKNKLADVEFIIPQTAPALSEPTRKIVERAMAEKKK